MNIANQLTTLRVILIPVFIFIFTSESIFFSNYLAALVFIIASLTDFLDGYLARKLNLVSNFGKIMDPLADKLLVLTALIYLAIQNIIPGWIVIIIIARELLITSLRALVADKGTILAASKLGKYKTATQMLSIVLLIIDIYKLGTILLYIAVILTIWSLFDYIIKMNKEISIF